MKKSILTFILITCIMLISVGCGEIKVEDSSTETQEETQDNQKIEEIGQKEETTESIQNEEEKIELPNVELKNKKISFYYWLDAKTQKALEGEVPRAIDLFEQKYGGKLETVLGTHEEYWQKLSALTASGDAPDFIYMPNWNWYPQAITSNIAACAEDYIDFNKPLWKGVQQSNEQYKWKGKIYTPIIDDYVCQWVYYNTSLFETYGLDTPRDYFERNEWTWNNFKDVAVQLTEDTDGDGEIDQWGFSSIYSPFIYTCGIPVVEKTSDGYFKHNLKDAKIADAMNMFYELGQAGLNVFGGSAEEMKTGKLAMFAFAPWGHSSDFRDAWERGEIEIAPLPVPTKDSQYVLPMKVQAHGIGNGCKNPEGAALLIELYRYTKTKTYLDYYESKGLLKNDLDADLFKSPLLTEDQKEYHKKLMELPQVSTAWETWYQQSDLGVDRVTKGEPWSKIVEEIYPEKQKFLEDYFEDNNKKTE